MTLRLRFAVFSLAAALCLGPSRLAAQSQRERPTPPAETKSADDGKALEKDNRHAEEKQKEKKPSVTHHEIRLDAKPFRYTATAGYMPMKDETGKLKANIFYVAYAKEGGPARRPVTFTFNGGPGSASVWLHMGAVGPKRVVMADDGQPLPPPYRLAGKEETSLAFPGCVVSL